MGLRLQLNYEIGVPIFRQIYDAVATALATREIGPNEQLPTIHELADQLDVNPNTIIRAYRELEQAGLIVSERGRGTFPAKGAKPQTNQDEKLRPLLRRFFNDCQRRGISQAEVMVFLRKELQ